MTVRVIKIDPPPALVREVLCRTCHATLEYAPEDVKTDRSTDRCGYDTGSEWIVCLYCSHRVTLYTW